MREASLRQRGFSLVIVLAAMLLLAGAFTVLTRTVVGFHQARALEAVRRTARLLADSGVAYVRLHGRTLGDTLVDLHPGAPLELEVSKLLPPNVEGTLRLTLDTEGVAPTCVIQAKAKRRGYAIKETRRVKLN